MKIGWKLESRFQITIHEKDKSELEAVKKSLGGGKIYKRRSQTIVFDVNSQKELVPPPLPPNTGGEGRGTCGAPEGTPRPK